MQMNHLVSDLGVGRAGALSSCSPTPTPRSASTLGALKGFCPRFQPPPPPYLTFGLPTREIPEGPTSAGRAPAGPPAPGRAWQPQGNLSRRAKPERARPCGPDSGGAEGAGRGEPWRLPAGPSSSRPDPSHTSAGPAPQAISWSPRPGAGAPRTLKGRTARASS